MTPIDPNHSAFPLPEGARSDGRQGLTIRAELAARAMEGLLAGDRVILSSTAEEAVNQADALIAALNRPTP